MITTPPGLYLLALPLRRLGVRLFSARAAAASGVEGDCGVTNLRGANLIGLLAIAVLAGMCRALLERRNATAGSSAVQQPPTGAGGAPDGRMRMEVLPVGLAHLVYGLLGKNEHAALANVGVATGIIAVGPTGTQPRRGRLGDVTDWPWMTLDALLTGALAVALFPPLFFFSALFYTDVLSTLVVLAAFYVHLLRLSGPAKVPVWRRTVLDAAVVVLGIAALLMRQTNVFWIVVFMGGREAVDAVLSVAAQSRINPASMVDIVWATKPFQFYLKEWWIGHVHDPPLSLAWPDGKHIIYAYFAVLPVLSSTPNRGLTVDFLFMALSMAVAMLGNVPRVLARVWPYIVVLLTFVRFVIWNGGVVLGM